MGDKGLLLMFFVNSLILERFDQFVNKDCEDGTCCWADPVDPVVGSKGTIDDARSKRTERVEGSARPEETCHQMLDAVI